MNKDKILAGSRMDNRGMDERELNLFTKAGLLSFRVGVVLCFVLMLLAYFLQGELNYCAWIVLLSM